MFAPEIPDPLDALDSALADTPHNLHAAFRDYLIGALSATAKPEHWQAALTNATRLTHTEGDRA